MDNRLGQGERRWRVRQRNRLGAKLSRQLKSSSIELLRRRNVGAISRGGAETEKNPGKMVVPVSHSAAGKESGHEMAVEPFHKTVGLGMVGGGRLVRDVEVRAEGNLQGRGELGLRLEVIISGTPKTRNPVVNQSGGTVRRHGGGQRNGFRPARSAVNKGEEVGVSRG